VVTALKNQWLPLDTLRSLEAIVLSYQEKTEQNKKISNSSYIQQRSEVAEQATAPQTRETGTYIQRTPNFPEQTRVVRNFP
jgi:hypothetical protein